MMAALERSEAAQRRLVADASHELRRRLRPCGPTSRRSGRTEQLDPEERKRLVADVTQELEEMTELVGDVVELRARPGRTRSRDRTSRWTSSRATRSSARKRRPAD